MKLFLIRHGETEWTQKKLYQGRTDVPLNAKGIRQAKKVAKALELSPPDRLFSSTLSRARRTAKEIADQFKLKVTADSRLNELDFGEWEGTTYTELSQRNESTLLKWQEGKLDRLPGGESVGSLTRRTNSFLKEMLKKYTNKTIAVVSHAGPIKMFLFDLLNSKRPPIWAFKIEPASITFIEGDLRFLQIVYTNRKDHLNE